MRILIAIALSLSSACLMSQSKQLENLKKSRNKAISRERVKLASTLKRIDSIYLKSLERLKTTLTKSGKLEDAMEVKREIDRLTRGGGAKAPAPTEEEPVAGSGDHKLARVSVKNAKLKRLAEGKQVFGDEGKYVWDKIPESYAGLKYWQPNGKHQAVTEMEVEFDGMVYVAVMERASKKASQGSLKGWNKLPWGLKQTDGTKWDVYSKNCKKGDTFRMQPDKYCAPIPLQ